MKSAGLKERVLLLFWRRETLTRCIPRLLLGATFVFSSTSKFPMHSEFVNLVNAYHLLPVWIGGTYATALPWVELLIGAYLILGVLIRPSAVIAGLVSMSFIVANTSSLMRGEKQCLHCFGQVIALSPTQALIIDIIMLGVATYLVIVSRRETALSFDGWFARRQRSKAAIAAGE
jgi:putative oxidoreductase